MRFQAKEQFFRAPSTRHRVVHHTSQIDDMKEFSSSIEGTVDPDSEKCMVISTGVSSKEISASGALRRDANVHPSLAIQLVRHTTEEVKEEVNFRTFDECMELDDRKVREGLQLSTLTHRIARCRKTRLAARCRSGFLRSKR